MLNTKSDWEISVSRKILKVLISLLFLAAAAVAAVLSITSFFPELFEEIKYGLKHIVEEPTKKTPAFKKDEQEQKPRVTPNYQEGKKYGVAPVRPIKPVPIEAKYGVAPVQRAKMEKEMRALNVSKYGVAPVQRPPYREQGEKYGVSSTIRKLEKENLLKNQMRNVNEYGVAPIDYEEELLKHQNKKDK